MLIIRVMGFSPSTDCLQVKTCIHEKCSREFEDPVLNDVIKSLTETVVGWIQQVYG